MSFSNCSYPLLQTLYYYQPQVFPYTCYQYMQTQTLPLLQSQSGQTVLGEGKSQNQSIDSIWSKIEQQLAKLHSTYSHHKKTHWSAEQDKLLQRLVEVQRLEWKEIPLHFRGRTQNMCYSRYRRISMSNKDRSWTTSDEEQLVGLVEKVGEKWKLISMRMHKFTPKQIRERYLNYLRPTTNKQQFTYQDDLTICKYVLVHGKHWRKMEQLLPGRAQGAIKGRYYGKLQNIIIKYVAIDRI